jgi:hypothetical protein
MGLRLRSPQRQSQDLRDMSSTKTERDERKHDAGFGESDPVDEAPDDQGEIVATAATIAVVAIGAAVFEAALLPGLALGVVATLAPRVLPNIGSAMAPLFRSSVRGAYRLGQRTREAVAEAQEHVSDIVAEANAEDRAKGAKPAAQAA